ncbi:MAG TPA: amino acid adenylation domain-containing protein [Gammaproteobacteria bacterium]|nr:amino acid adenylation domain-containing protein [Gammaproteobacteria bacterium]
MPRLLQNWVSEQAQHRPEASAVVCSDQRISYGGIEALSNRIARALRTSGLRRGQRVCLLMPKTPLAIACLLGIYKAGGIYVPLDPKSPAKRLSRIVRSCDSRWLLAAGRVQELVQRIACRRSLLRRTWTVGWLDEAQDSAGVRARFTLADVLGCPASAPAQSARSRDVAHILYTSGSTGTPKGVAITHANVVAFVEWARDYFGLCAEDRLSAHSPLHFDLSVFDIFGAFAAGAELHLVPVEGCVLPNELADWIRCSRVTQWFSVPSALNYLAKFDVLKTRDFPALRRVLWCGEVLPTPTLIYWMRRVPQAHFTNLYGPTEATIASSYYTLATCPDDPLVPVPIGQPCGGETLHVLDEQLQPVKPGTTGELYIAGAGLSPGYWRNPEETAKAFVRSPDGKARLYRTGDLARIDEDGLVHFIGRKDTQIKSRGYRIELGEVEAALNTLDALRESAVIAVPSGDFDGMTICCAYVANDSNSSSPAKLRRELSRLLPEYMLPSQWKAFETLPKNPAGKIDRRSLKEAWSLHGSPAS